MKNILFFSLLLFISGCQSNESSISIPGQGSYSIINDWTSEDGTKSFNLIGYEIGVQKTSGYLIFCNGSLANTDQINGVDAEQILISGSFSSGTVQIGQLSHVGASDSRCADLSAKKLSYSVSTETNLLTLCDESLVCENYHIN